MHLLSQVSSGATLNLYGNESESTTYESITYNGGLITGGNATSEGGGISVAGTLNMYGGTVAGNKSMNHGGGVYVNEGGSFTMYNGEISSNTAPLVGGGIYVAGDSAGKLSTSFVMEGGSISNNETTTTITSSGKGGGVYVQYGTFTMNGGTISANSAISGGGVFATANSTFEMTSNAIITLNNASRYGGGIYADNVDITIKGGTIFSNTASRDGGGIYASGSTSTITISGGEISSNKAEGDAITSTTTNFGYGGGIYSDGEIEMSGGTITNNTVSSVLNYGYGGGIYISSTGTFDMTAGEISSNTASRRGGGIFAIGDIDISGGKISNNKVEFYASTGYGGGIYSTGDIDISGGEISGNMVAYMGGSTSSYIYGYGGGIYSTGEIVMSSGTISGNKILSAVVGDDSKTIYSHGGGIYSSGNIKLTGGTISKNEVSYSGSMNSFSYGGGVYFIDNTSASNKFLMTSATATDGTTTYVTITGNSAASGGGIYLLGTLDIESGTISENTASRYGGGIYVNDNNSGTGVLTIKDATINNNTASQYGGGVYNVGTITLTTGEITLNEVGDETVTSSYGGGIYNTGTLNIDGGEISKNVIHDKNSGRGAGVYNTDSGTIKMTGGSIFENNAHEGTSDSGGGVYSMGDMTMSGGKIYNNSAYTGGGLSVMEGSTFTMSGGKIYENTADDGAGMYVNATVEISNESEISGNIAEKSGGGIYVLGSGVVSLSDSALVENNKATTSGGGVYIAQGTLTMSDDSAISENESALASGVYISSRLSSLTMTGGEITGNIGTADSVTSAGVYSEGSIYLSGDPVVSGNTYGSYVIDDNGTDQDDTDDTSTYKQSGDSNVYLTSGKYIILNGTLDNDATIGVTLQNGIGTVGYGLAYTSSGYLATQADSAKFTSDNASYGVLTEYVSDSQGYLIKLAESFEEYDMDDDGSEENGENVIKVVGTDGAEDLESTTTYNGNDQTPTLSLAVYEMTVTTVNEEVETTYSKVKNLTQGTDFTVTWYTDDDCENVATSLTDAGTYYGKITGKGSYTGDYSQVYEFEIEKDTLSVLSVKTTAGATYSVYNGTAQDLVVTLIGANSKETFTATTIDWTRSGSTTDNFTNAGTITATVSSSPDTNHKIESAQGSFTIYAKSITSSDISVASSDDNYEIVEDENDATISPSISVVDSSISSSVGYTITWTYTSSFASGVVGESYDITVSGNDFSANGVYTATIEGTGNYKDSQTLTFTNKNDNTVPVVTLYASYDKVGTNLESDFFNQWQGESTLVFYAKDSVTNNAKVVGMDHATITINGTSFEMTADVINAGATNDNVDTYGEGYLDITTGTIYLKSYDDNKAEYYANATDSTDEKEYSLSDINTAVYFKAEILTTDSDAGDTEILTTLTFNPSSATIYTIGVTATDANGNTSSSFTIPAGTTAQTSVTLSIDPRVDVFNALYDDIFNGTFTDTDDDKDIDVDDIKYYFKNNTTDSNYLDNAILVYEAFNYHAELETLARDGRIEGVDIATNVIGSNKISWDNYKDLIKIYNAIDHDEVAESAANKSLAEKLKEAKEKVEGLYAPDDDTPIDLDALKDAISELEDIYEQTLDSDGVIDGGIKTELEKLIKADTGYGDDKDITGYIQRIEDFIAVNNVIETLEIEAETRSELEAVINAWEDLSDEAKAIAEDMKASKSPTFANKISETEIKDNYSYAEILADVSEYEKAVAQVLKYIDENDGLWDITAKEAISVLTEEFSKYEGGKFTLGFIEDEDFSYEGANLSSDIIKYLSIGTVTTVEGWISDLSAIAYVECLIEIAKTAVNDNESLFDDNALIDPDHFSDTLTKATTARSWYDKLDSKLQGAVSNYDDATDDEDFAITIKGQIDAIVTPMDASDINLDNALGLVEVEIKIELLKVRAAEELDAKYTQDDWTTSDEFEVIVLALDWSTSTVYDILYVENFYNNLSDNAKELVRNYDLLQKYVAVANKIYTGGYESTVDENGNFIGYYGEDSNNTDSADDYVNDYVVGKIYNLYYLDYEDWELDEDSELQWIAQVNQEIVEIIYGANSVVEYSSDVHDLDKTTATFLNWHHAFYVDGDVYYIHDEIWNQTTTDAGFWDFGTILTKTVENVDFYSYSETLTNEQQVIMNSVGAEYEYLVSLLQRLTEAHIAASNLPEDDLDDCEGEDHTVQEHYEAVELAKMALERLSSSERLLLGEDLVTINEQYEALIRHMAGLTEDSLDVTYTAVDSDVSVIGLVTQVEYLDSKGNVANDYDSITAYVWAKEYASASSVSLDEDTSDYYLAIPDEASWFDGMNVLVGYNIKLYAEITTGQNVDTVEVQPAEGNKVVSVVKIPNNTLTSSVVLYHINDANTDVSIIDDVTFFWEGTELYASFTTTSFSSFLFTGDVDTDYIEPEKEIITTTTSSSSGSGTVLDTHDPEITEEDGKVTITDANLDSVTVNGQEVDLDGNNVIIDLNEYPNGTYEVIAMDKYGRTSSVTVVIANDSVVAESTTTPTIVPETIPSTTVEEKENGICWIWILLIIFIILVIVIWWFFLIWKRRKEEEEEEEEIIVTEEN